VTSFVSTFDVFLSSRILVRAPFSPCYDLQKVAHHTVRLKKNWSRENPRIIGAVSTTQCEGVDGPLCILSVILGTNILVLCDDSQLFCYDLPAATSSPPLRIGEMYCYAQFDERGKQFICVAHVMENVYATIISSFRVRANLNYLAFAGISSTFFVWNTDQGHRQYCEECIIGSLLRRVGAFTEICS